MAIAARREATIASTSMALVILGKDPGPKGGEGEGGRMAGGGTEQGQWATVGGEQ